MKMKERARYEFQNTVLKNDHAITAATFTNKITALKQEVIALKTAASRVRDDYKTEILNNKAAHERLFLQWIRNSSQNA